MANRKYVVVTGGVLSGLGKGVAAASIGLFFSDEKKVVPIKLDGYLNTDPGTMNPTEHGEVFVLDDGFEVDMDFGHYERFLGGSGSKAQSITMGRIYKIIRMRERRGEYLGRTVQLIPHVTDLIQEKILEVGENEGADVVLVEVGGTVGDLENELFLEAVKQLGHKVGKENVCYVHLTYVPIPSGVNEQKSKPSQQSISLLQQKGIWPNVVLGRCSEFLTDKIRDRISLFSNLDMRDVFSAVDVDCIYKIPQMFDEQGLVERICEVLHLDIPSKSKLVLWNKLLATKREQEIVVTIAGKYTDLEDSYASVVESLVHCGFNLGVNIRIEWLDTSGGIDFGALRNSDAVIVPGGFGSRGIEGKIEVIKFVRENRIPFLGICYGLQLAVVEFLRNVCGVMDANSMEVEKDGKSPVITLLDEQRNVVKMGGTMRLGSYDAILREGKILILYERAGLVFDEGGKKIVKERHRHRYEVNPEFVSMFEEKGLRVIGVSQERELVEFVELEDSLHPYFVATQAHPELKSKLEKPAPLFYGLIENALRKKIN